MRMGLGGKGGDPSREGIIKISEQGQLQKKVQ